MALTGAQVKQLRSMAHHLNPALIIGKSDVNEGTVEQTVAYLEKHELVKCSVLDGSSLSAREAAEELAERCHADVVQVIGCPKRPKLTRAVQSVDFCWKSVENSPNSLFHFKL